MYSYKVHYSVFSTIRLIVQLIFSGLMVLACIASLLSLQTAGRGILLGLMMGFWFYKTIKLLLMRGHVFTISPHYLIYNSQAWRCFGAETMIPLQAIFLIDVSKVRKTNMKFMRIRYLDDQGEEHREVLSFYAAPDELFEAISQLRWKRGIVLMRDGFWRVD